MSNRPWVVVEYAGTDQQSEVQDFDLFRLARRFVEQCYSDADIRQIGVDVMKRCPDGSLTTEF